MDEWETIDAWGRRNCTHYVVSPCAIVAVNGVKQLRDWCHKCERIVPASLATRIKWLRRVDEVPVRRSNLSNTACEHCQTEGPVEYHHWAPRAIFEDSDDWPASTLCPKCHSQWHRYMTPYLSRIGRFDGVI